LYVLQAKVDSMQQDIVSLSLTMVALRSDLDQRASAQNVSRLETDSAKLQQDVTALQGEVAQKASVQSVAQLQAQVNAAEARLRQKADAASTPRFADLPVTPNLLQDTKHFHGICSGQVGVETPWAHAWGSPWNFFNYRGTAVDVASSTVDMTTQASAGRAGLWPLGALSASRGGLLQDTLYGADLRALLLTVRTLPAADQSAVGVIYQGCPTYTSWDVGSFTTEVGVFVNVLEHTGNIQLRYASNAGAGVLIEGPAALGWQYLHNSQAGWGGCQQSFIRGEGRMRVAIALPYQSFGNHSGVPVWAGFDPSFFLGNS